MRRFVIICILLSLPVMAAAGKTVKVKVQKGTLFHEPKFFSKAVASVKYGDRLEMIEQLKDWAYVRFREKTGWIHKSSLTSAGFNLGTIFVGTSSSGTTHDEVALAGKGFTPEIERGYKQDHPEMNYALVDEIESYDVKDDSLYGFIEEGGLKITEAK